MKKVFLFAVLAIVLFAGSFALSYMIMSAVSLPKAEPADNATQEIADDGTVKVVISAVGDCTLGTDVSFGIGGSFDAEFDANEGDYSYFLSKVKSIFEKDDITIINMEGPISDRGVKADKKYTFRGLPEYANILSISSVEAASLSNNHSMDYGKEAYEDTAKHLSDSGISAFGAESVSVIEVKGIRVGLIGVNALESIQRANFAKNMEKLKAMNPDIIVASFHWGEEKAIKANADQVSLAHNAVDMGADLVLGHHPHVLQGIEKYKGKYIAYSLGNFCFGGNKNPDDKDTMIFTQTFTFKDGVLTEDESASVIPCLISSVKERNNFQPVLAKGKDAKRIANKIASRSSGYEGIENVAFLCE